MKKMILIVVVIGLVVAFFAIRNKKKKEEEAAKLAAQTSGNYVGVNTPGGTYGIDVDQAMSVYEQIAGLFGSDSGSTDSSKSPVNCEGMTAEERSSIMNSDNYTCA